MNPQVIGLSCVEGVIAQWQWMPQVVILSYLCKDERHRTPCPGAQRLNNAHLALSPHHSPSSSPPTLMTTFPVVWPLWKSLRACGRSSNAKV